MSALSCPCRTMRLYIMVFAINPIYVGVENTYLINIIRSQRTSQPKANPTQEKVAKNGQNRTSRITFFSLNFRGLGCGLGL